MVDLTAWDRGGEYNNPEEPEAPHKLEVDDASDADLFAQAGGKPLGDEGETPYDGEIHTCPHDHDYVLMEHVDEGDGSEHIVLHGCPGESTIHLGSCGEAQQHLTEAQRGNA